MIMGADKQVMDKPDENGKMRTGQGLEQKKVDVSAQALRTTFSHPKNKKRSTMIVNLLNLLVELSGIEPLTS